MLERGLAYRCYMQPAELDALRAEQMARGEKPRYDGRWRPENAAQGKPPPPGVAPVIRFRNPRRRQRGVGRPVKGRIEIANAELDDLVIARPDGTPTYNFCVVVDDIDMRITHVIRGDDHVNNTPRQINIFRALGARAAGVRARADGARRGRAEALQAPRRGQRDAVRGRRATCPRRWSTSSRASAGRTATTRCSRRDAVRRVVRPRRDQSRAVALQRRQAELGQPGAHEAAGRGGRSARASCPTSSAPASIPSSGPGAGRRRRAAARSRRTRSPRWPTPRITSTRRRTRARAAGRAPE